MNPFPGLRPYHANEANLFMGREVIQGSVATRVRISSLTLLVARSGVGKSSFLMCRLIPQLQKDSDIRYLNEWGSAPPEALIARSLETFHATRNGFREKPLIVLDQFEDVFKLPSPRESLWDRIAELVNLEDSVANILISMREEWLGAWEESTDFIPPNIGTVIRLAPLNSKELTRAIRRPPEIEGSVTVDPELPDLLIRDLRRPSAFGLGDGNVEPGLLQLVLQRLWHEASGLPDRRMSVTLYERLGRADRISREFVWNELGRAGSEGSRFSTYDRVLWAGMTRHLVVAQGIKAITDAPAMARKLRMEDMGFAGAAVAKIRLPKLDNEYLKEMPERRGDPPPRLVAWISDVIEKGVEAGFIKQQRGLPAVTGGQAQSSAFKHLFELSHDSLSNLFQQFSVEFESWVRGRWAKLVGILGGGLVALPFFVISVITQGLIKTLIELATLVIFIVVELVLIVLIFLAAEYLFGLIGYPIVRRLARGVVPLPSERQRQQSPWAAKVTKFARRLGFLPR
jgi:hypothetical protein